MVRKLKRVLKALENRFRLAEENGEMPLNSSGRGDFYIRMIVLFADLSNVWQGSRHPNIEVASSRRIEWRCAVLLRKSEPILQRLRDPLQCSDHACLPKSKIIHSKRTRRFIAPFDL